MQYPLSVSPDYLENYLQTFFIMLFLRKMLILFTAHKNVKKIFLVINICGFARKSDRRKYSLSMDLAVFQ